MQLKSLLVLMLLSGIAMAQVPGDVTTEDQLFARKHYGPALPAYLSAIKTNSASGIVYYKAATCYLNSRSQKQKAIEYFEKALQLSPSLSSKTVGKDTEAPIDIFVTLGDAYHQAFRFDEAIASYEKYLALLNLRNIKDPATTNEIRRRIQTSKFCKELKETVGMPSEFKPENIIKSSGSSVGEFSSALSPDKTTMIYTYKVPVSKIKTQDDDKYFEEIPGLKEIKTDSTPATTTRKKGKDHQDTIVNITTVGTSVDGHVVLTYRDDKGEGNLYISRLNANRWTNPTKIPKTVNLNGWEPDEFMTPDGSTLYFVSSRAGGYGGKDIYCCKKNHKGEWGKAFNLGPTINSAFDDEAPFLHPDGTTLYFSSNRYKPTKCFDVFTSSLAGNTWTKPAIVSYPINSSDENSFYQVTEDKKKIYASASQQQKDEEARAKKNSPNKKKLSRKDSIAETEKTPKENYVITFENPMKSGLTLLKGVVTSGSTEAPVEAEITVTDLDSAKTIGTYYSHKNSGIYTIVLPPGKNLAITYEAEGFLFQTEHHRLERGKNYFEKRPPVVFADYKEGSKTVLNNVFFENEKAEIKKISEQELDRVYKLLENNPALKLKVCNYIYTEDKSYKYLSKDRADAVVRYLIEKGIDNKRLEAKGERKSQAPKKKEDKDVVVPDPPKLIQSLEIEIVALKN